LGVRGAVISLLLFVGAAYAALTLFALLVGERLIFQPPPPSYDEADLPFTRVPVAGGGWIALLHLPNPGAEYTVLFSHGNAEDLGHLRPILELIRDAGFSVVAYDYRGYGRSSPARPRVAAAVADAEAAHRHVVTELGVPAERLVLHGRSLGSGPTLELAARHGAAGIVLESAFTSTYRVVTRVAILPFDRFRNIDHVRTLEMPLLVIHGMRDAVIPFSHGRRLFDLAAEPKRALWVEHAGHNDLAWVAGARYTRALADFGALAAAAGRGAG
jgi:abhydrolase domain-containing protein 17